jgi:putative ABC transport system permease protein
VEIRHMLSALWRNRTGPILIALQIAIALTVLVNVAYVVEQRLETYTRPTGLDIDNIFWIATSGFRADYNHAAAVESDLQWLNSLPGVVAAADTISLPQTYSGYGLPFSASPDEKAPREGGRVTVMTARGIETLGVQLASGRTYSPDAVTPPQADGIGQLGKWAPEVVVTQAMADAIFPKGDALGKTLYVGLVNQSAKIVGIIKDLQMAPVVGPFSKFASQVVIVPGVPPGPNATYMVRTQPGRQAEVMARVDKEMGDREPSRYIALTQTLTKTAADTKGWIRSSSIILGAVAILVLAVTAIGIFGMAAFNVATRTRQIGTRRAVGARKFHILRYFFVENWLITTSGVVIGCLAALALGVQMSRMIQLPRLPLYYLVGGTVFVWVLGLAAVWVPARRAAAISPAVATRTV